MKSLICRRVRSLCLVSIFLILLLIISIDITSAAVAVTSVIYPINCILCRILTILWGVTAAITTFVIVLAGIKWMGSMEDPTMRAQAKTTIIHAIVGLIIVTIAIQVVGWAVQNTVAGTYFDPADWMPASDCARFCT